MGAALRARALLGLAAIGPWLVWLPFVRGPAAVVLLGALAIAGSVHGWGRLLARLTRVEVGNPILVMWWGTAVVSAVAGVSLAFHAYDARLILIVGTVAHTLDLGLRFVELSERIGERLTWQQARYWLLPVGLLLALAMIHLLGSAGAVVTRPFDDDGHVVAQAKRLLDTGALADPVGYARDSQLGSYPALCALAGGFADVRALRLVDGGLGFALALALALACIRPRNAISTLCATLLVLLASAVAIRWPELAPFWIAVGLVVALHMTSTVPGAVPIAAVTAGAAIALREELAGPALVLLFASWWRSRRPWRVDRGRVLALVGALALAVFPYLLASALAWRSVDPGARVLLDRAGMPFPLRLVVAAAVAAAAAPLVWLPWRELGGDRLRWFALASAAGVGALSVQGTFATHYLWVLAFAGAVVLVIELASVATLTHVGVVFALLACVLGYDARLAHARRSWSGRYAEWIENAEYQRNAVSTAEHGYSAIFAEIPPGERVAVWVARPDTLDYRRNEIFDLRTPRAARFRVPGGDDARLARIVSATRARWLVIERDDLFRDRAQRSGLYALLCLGDFPWCADSLESLIRSDHVVAEHDGVVLVKLR